MISHFTIHSPYFIVLNQCSIVSHLLLALPSLPIHCGVSMFVQALLHILNGVSYCSLEDSIWYSWFSQQSISVVVYSKTVTESSNLNFSGVDLCVKSSPTFLLMFLLFQLTKCYLLHSFPSEKHLCLDSPPNYVGSFIWDCWGMYEGCCIVKVISTQSMATLNGYG